MPQHHKDPVARPVDVSAATPACPASAPSTPASAALSPGDPPSAPPVPAPIPPIIPPPVEIDPERTGPPDYNPADYRWVPVRRRPRRDGWTEEKQRRFIEVLADTGIVLSAAKAVGMTRESAHRLRRSPHGAAFARAWDAARHHAGSMLEDIAFERAIEGVEHNVFDEFGNVVCTKRVYNDRLLTFLLSALKPERYGRAASPPRAARIAPPEVFAEEEAADTAHASASSANASPASTSPASASPAHILPTQHLPAHRLLDESLRAMEPPLPAAPEDLLDEETLAHELEIAECADGILPGFLFESPPILTDEQRAAREAAARYERGKALYTSGERATSDEQLDDLCAFLDPGQKPQLGRRRLR